MYWHFQGCHNPRRATSPTRRFRTTSEPPLHGTRRAMPFAFRCGRLVVLVLDSRGDRDVFRTSSRSLGPEQWAAHRARLRQHASRRRSACRRDADADRLDRPGRPGDEAVRRPYRRRRGVQAGRSRSGSFSLRRGSHFENFPLAAVDARGRPGADGTPVNLGRFMLSNIDEARDQWSHKFSRSRARGAPDRKAGRGAARQPQCAAPRASLLFLSGDIHMGCIFDLTSLVPPFKAVSLTSSGISAPRTRSLVLGVFVDEEVPSASGSSRSCATSCPTSTSASCRSSPRATAPSSTARSRTRATRSPPASTYPTCSRTEGPEVGAGSSLAIATTLLLQKAG